MKVILFALGSRGDIEPFLGIAEILKGWSWEIICVFPEQFREMTESEGYKFYGFSKEFIEILIQGEQGKLITSGEGSFFKRAKAMFSLIKSSGKLNKEINETQRKVLNEENPDFVFYHQKCLVPVAWGMQNTGKSIFINPFPCVLHETENHSLIGPKGGGDYGNFLNRMSYFIPNIVKPLAIYFSSKKYQRDLRIKLSPLKIRKFLLKKEKAFYTISPSLFTKPKNWHEKINVVGYYERTKTRNWKPKQELLDFLQNNEKIVFISFGSISNTNPKEKTSIILNVLKKHKIPAIINTCWGGLEKPSEYPEHILFVENIPYDWIFPRVHAVIHHGGSGTTHTALKYGCASLVIPHFIDQFFWGKTVEKVGAGPKGISIKNLNELDFETKILDLLNNENYKFRAEEIGKKMQMENDLQKLKELILA